MERRRTRERKKEYVDFLSCFSVRSLVGWLPSTMGRRTKFAADVAEEFNSSVWKNPVSGRDDSPSKAFGSESDLPISPRKVKARESESSENILLAAA